MMENKISVVTVTYNCKDTILETINSIKKQTYENIEYIIIDGGSNDGTLEIINQNSEFIDILISESDHGIYDAMNKGIESSSGDYVIFMNSGDIFYDETVLNIMIKSVTEQDQIIYGDHWVVGSRRSDGYHKAKKIEEIKYGMVCSHQSILYKKKVLLNNKFRLDYGTAGDFEHLCRLYYNKVKFKYIPIIISYYKAGGVSDKNRITSLILACRVLKQYGFFNIKVFFVFSYRVVREFLLKLIIRM